MSDTGYLREPPDIEPALAGALLRFDKIGEDEIVGSLLDLVARRFVSMRVSQRRVTTIAGALDSETLEFALDTSRWEELPALDRELCTFLFTGMAHDSTLTLEELRWQTMRRSSGFEVGLDHWRKTVLGELERRGLARLSAFGWRLMVDGKSLRRSVEAFRAYLRDFGALDDDPPEAIVLWERYLAWAALFGLANETLDALPVRIPSLAEDPNFTVLRDAWRARRG